jgi:hypothetical protein
MKNLAELNAIYLKSLKNVNLALQCYLNDEITHIVYQIYYKTWCKNFDELTAKNSEVIGL